MKIVLSTARISKNIQEKSNYIDDGGKLDHGLIAVGDASAGNGRSTFFDGNRRAITFLLRDELV